ncbi:heparinase II/III family protein [Deefgea piscis]|uniref:Heparinase II/III family protein n=1 Tax=Deefgea piscis TaxID=2739061 RepID=A0A6M8SYJ2_9NEIS|nr:heparinase II/III family protein [Deefgea piscis]QKJ66857.1 heparinase II/III family protein [Deefgea piscis]
MRLFYCIFFSLIASYSFADWIDISDPLTVKAFPSQQADIKQNPPQFRWPQPARIPSGYEVQILSSQGKSSNYTVARNWLLPSQIFAADTYSWRVRTTTAGAAWSDWRKFTITANADVFLVPEHNVLLSRLKAKSRPKSLPISGAGIEAWRQQINSTRANAVLSLRNDVDRYMQQAILTDADMPLVAASVDESAWAASLTNIRQRINAETAQLRNSALLWQITRDPRYFSEAIRRGNGLIALNLKGATHFKNQDQATRAIAWGLVQANDFLALDLPSAIRTAWLNNAKSRTLDMYRDLANSYWRLDQRPFDSHGSTQYGYVAAISALLVGDVPEADLWFRDTFRGYAQYINPFGGEDGGFAGGTAYAEYSADVYLQLWDPLSIATGVSFYDKPWSKGLLDFFAYFVPPGTPSHLFGDAAETKPVNRLLKAYASRFNTPLAAWYYRNLVGDESPSSLLSAPIPLPIDGLANTSPDVNSQYLPTIGWAAMHSELADRSRTSVYFKSSPYGSFNHSHGDQNTFTLVDKGRPILVDSGVYDWYGSPHFYQWYRQTKAHNGITFDGGKGQIVDDDMGGMAAKGKITQYQFAGNIDMVEGDATQAYGGQLSQALRRIWYLRDQNLIVVWDKLKSPVARKFEWNLHANEPFELANSKQYILPNKDNPICIDRVWPETVSLNQTTGYDTLPEMKTAATIWNLRVATSLNTEQQFVHIINLNCLIKPDYELDLKQSKMRLGDKSIDF